MPQMPTIFISLCFLSLKLWLWQLPMPFITTAAIDSTYTMRLSRHIKVLFVKLSQYWIKFRKACSSNKTLAFKWYFHVHNGVSNPLNKLGANTLFTIQLQFFTLCIPNIKIETLHPLTTTYSQIALSFSSS